MKRYWISWWTDPESCEDADCVPFNFWISGERNLFDEDETEFSVCACVDADNVEAAWEKVQRHFAVIEKRFCDKHELIWTPGGDRFKFNGKLRTG